jgi:hypothetical protein
MMKMAMLANIFSLVEAYNKRMNMSLSDQHTDEASSIAPIATDTMEDESLTDAQQDAGTPYGNVNHAADGLVTPMMIDTPLSPAASEMMLAPSDIALTSSQTPTTDANGMSVNSMHHSNDIMPVSTVDGK